MEDRLTRSNLNRRINQLANGLIGDYTGSWVAFLLDNCKEEELGEKMIACVVSNISCTEDKLLDYCVH